MQSTFGYAQVYSSADCSSGPVEIFVSTGGTATPFDCFPYLGGERLLVGLACLLVLLLASVCSGSIRAVVSSTSPLQQFSNVFGASPFGMQLYFNSNDCTSLLNGRAYIVSEQAQLFG